MFTDIQLAKASRLVQGKGDDSVFCSSLNSTGCFILGVADGISTANGGDAARWIKTAMESIATEAGTEFMGGRQLFERFQEVLETAAGFSHLPNSYSTLSCGIGRVLESRSGSYIRFEFFGIGDSPIWRVIPCKEDDFVFQVSPVYSPPTPGEQGCVYSSVDLNAGKIDGAIHFGSVDLNKGELLIVATDGLPDTRVVFDDQDPDLNKRSPRLLENLLRAQSFNDKTLEDAITAYDAHRLLIDDDASVAVVRWGRSVLYEIFDSDADNNEIMDDDLQEYPDLTDSNIVEVLPVPSEIEASTVDLPESKLDLTSQEGCCVIQQESQPNVERDESLVEPGEPTHPH